MNIHDWMTQLDKLIELFDKKVLTDTGIVSHDEAVKKAEIEYRKYQEKTLSGVEREFLENIKGVEKEIGKKESIKK